MNIILQDEDFYLPSNETHRRVLPTKRQVYLHESQEVDISKNSVSLSFVIRPVENHRYNLSQRSKYTKAKNRYS